MSPRETMSNANEISGVEAFEALFDAEHDRLFRLLVLVTTNRGEAEELMQESFLKLWERWDAVQTHPNVEGYLYKTAFNLSRNRLRRAVHQARSLWSPTEAEDGLARVEDREALLPALRGLTRRQRAALLLVEVMDLSSEQAAEVLRVRPATVRVLASKARAAMRQALEASDG